MDIQYQEAGGEDKPPIQITPEMVEAGVKVLLEEYDQADPDLDRFVKRIYFVMASISL